MVMIPVSDGVIASYNGVVFNSTIKSRFTETPVESDDRRVIKYSRILIEISGYITQQDAGAATVDEYVETLRRKLSVNCKTLVYVNKGVGVSLRVNDPASKIWDVQFGPKPSAFVFKPLGGAPLGCAGGFFQWSVVTHLPECLAAQYKPGKGVFSQVAFSVTYEINEFGLATIVTRGTAQIPLTLNSDNTLDGHIDQYIYDIITPAPDGFLRRMTRTISEDRANCSFTITDVQQGLPPPEDCVKIEMKHRVSQKGVADTMWNASISGTLQMSPTAPKFLSWQRFFSIAFDRIRWARQPAIDRGVTHLMCDFEEDLFSNSATFSIRYRMNGRGFSFANIMEASGLWRPVVNSPNVALAERWTAQSWSRSLSDNAQKPGGLLGASFDLKADVIVDVCNQATNRGSSVTNPRLHSTSDKIVDEADAQPSPGLVDKTEPELLKGDPEPDTSWIAWECDVERDVDHHLVRHKPLTGKVKYDRPKHDPLGKVGPIMNDDDEPTFGFRADVDDIVQQVSAPSITIRLIGFGVREGFRVNPPKLITYGGKPASLKHEIVRESTLGKAVDAVFFRTDWDLTYIIASPPHHVPVPANPLLGTDGQ